MLHHQMTMCLEIHIPLKPQHRLLRMILNGSSTNILIASRLTCRQRKNQMKNPSMMRRIWRSGIVSGRTMSVMRWLRWFYFICFIVFISLVIPCLQVTQVILSFSLHLIFGLIGSYLIWRLYSILEGHFPSYRYLVLWTLL